MNAGALSIIIFIPITLGTTSNIQFSPLLLYFFSFTRSFRLTRQRTSKVEYDLSPYKMTPSDNISDI